MFDTKPMSVPGRKIRQKRGQKTYDALIATGFELLTRNEFESVTIAELARASGYSVGAFYARFRSKDEYLDALVAHHFKRRRKIRERLFARSSRETLVHDVVKELVTYYWKHRGFWRAALVRAMREPRFWKPLREYRDDSAEALVDEISRYAGRKLSPEEEANVRFAFLMALGVINNSIVNRPGPTLFQGQKRFIENLTRAFDLVCDYDVIVSHACTAG